MPTPARRAISSTPTSSPRSWKAARVAAMMRSRLRCASRRRAGFAGLTGLAGAGGTARPFYPPTAPEQEHVLRFGYHVNRSVCSGTPNAHPYEPRTDALDRHHRPLQVDRPLEHDARRPDGDRELVDPPDRPAGHLPRDPDRPARARQHELPALDDPELPRRHRRARREPRPPRRRLRPRADVQPRLRRLHARLDPAVGDVDDRLGGRAVADRDARRPGHRRGGAVFPLQPGPHPRPSPPPPPPPAPPPTAWGG